MKAVRVHRFGLPGVMALEDLNPPREAADELVVKVAAAGVGPWDAWIRAGRSVLPQPLPLTLGSDIAGIVDTVGRDVVGFAPGDEVYGVTNPRFVGGYAEFAAASAAMMAKKPKTASFLEAASLPVIAATAWQMLFDHAHLEAGQRILILGAAGNVGSMAVQLARLHGAQVFAECSAEASDRMLSLGADAVIDGRPSNLQTLSGIDVVIDTSGGEKRRHCLSAMKRGAVLISSVDAPDADLLRQHGVTGGFILVKATTWYLDEIARLIDGGTLKSLVGTVLPLEDARLAHELLEGDAPHAPGKIVLSVTGRPARAPA
jgi:NADPH:quinone reductase-like Zn-dependent oxidoreductase